MSLEPYFLSSSFRSLASNSLLGGYFGKLDGSQGRGSVLKNCRTRQLNFYSIPSNIIRNNTSTRSTFISTLGREKKKKCIEVNAHDCRHTSLLRAKVADPLCSGSIASSLFTRARAEGGKLLNVSERQLL